MIKIFRETQRERDREREDELQRVKDRLEAVESEKVVFANFESPIFRHFLKRKF